MNRYYSSINTNSHKRKRSELDNDINHKTPNAAETHQSKRIKLQPKKAKSKSSKQATTNKQDKKLFLQRRLRELSNKHPEPEVPLKFVIVVALLIVITLVTNQLLKSKKSLNLGDITVYYAVI